MLLTEQLVEIACTGGSLVVDCSVPADDLVRIAESLTTGATLTVKNRDLSFHSTILISSSAPGQVIFDFT